MRSKLKILFAGLVLSCNVVLAQETVLQNLNGRTLLLNRDNDDSWLTFHDANDIWYSMGIDRSNGLAFSLNEGGSLNSSQFVMTWNGNVGLGVANPGVRLDVNGEIKSRLSPDVFPDKNVARIVPLGYSGITGAMNWSLRGVYQHWDGVNMNAVGGDLDLIKSLNGNTVLGTRTDGHPLGNVGIGTTDPQHKLDVEGNAEFGTGTSNLELIQTGQAFEIRHHDPGMAWRDISLNPHGGNIGIGTPTPITKLTVNGGDISIGNWDNHEFNVWFLASDNSQRSSLIGNSSGNVYSDYVGLSTTWGSIRFRTNYGQERMRIDFNGNVGIGTTTPSEKLSVNGTIRSKEVKVEATGWPDYVFSADYSLPTLEETKSYIEANHHLPEVPSAKEMEENGVALGEMNMLLLKKIEELTLHVIAQNEIIAKLKEERTPDSYGRKIEELTLYILEQEERIEKLENVSR